MVGGDRWGEGGANLSKISAAQNWTAEGAIPTCSSSALLNSPLPTPTTWFSLAPLPASSTLPKDSNSGSGTDSASTVPNSVGTAYSIFTTTPGGSTSNIPTLPMRSERLREGKPLPQGAQLGSSPGVRQIAQTPLGL